MNKIFSVLFAAGLTSVLAMAHAAEHTVRMYLSFQIRAGLRASMGAPLQAGMAKKKAGIGSWQWSF